jgi:hypothetical protein
MFANTCLRLLTEVMNGRLFTTVPPPPPPPAPSNINQLAVNLAFKEGEYLYISISCFAHPMVAKICLQLPTEVMNGRLFATVPPSPPSYLPSSTNLPCIWRPRKDSSYKTPISRAFAHPMAAYTSLQLRPEVLKGRLFITVPLPLPDAFTTAIFLGLEGSQKSKSLYQAFISGIHKIEIAVNIHDERLGRSDLESCTGELR